MCHQLCSQPISGGAGITEERVEVPGAKQALPSFFARPEAEPAPAIVIIHDIWGTNDFYHDLARRLAGEGFATLLPDFFVHLGPLPEQTREAALERQTRLDQATAIADVAAAIGWLRNDPATTGKVGTVGFCMGGSLVMFAAARPPIPDAGVAFYGFPVRQRTELAPRNPIDDAAEVRSPLLGLWGDQDHGVGMDNVEAYRKALTDHGKRHEFVIYPGLPHAFLTFDPASPNFEGAQDAWTRTLAFLRAELTS